MGFGMSQKRGQVKEGVDGRFRGHDGERAVTGRGHDGERAVTIMAGKVGAGVGCGQGTLRFLEMRGPVKGRRGWPGAAPAGQSPDQAG